MPLAYLFRSGRRMRLEQAGPREFTYGYAELAATGASVGILEESDFGLDREWLRFFEAIANRISALTGIHPRTFWRLYRARARFAPYQTVVATNHALGLALALLGRLGCVQPKTTLLTMGLVEPGASKLRHAWLEFILKNARLAVLSKSEAESLRDVFADRLDIRSFVFGVDLDFWTPDRGTVRDGDVISVGNDWKRDFATLVAAWRPEFPQLSIVTSLELKSDKPNVRIERGDWRSAQISDIELRDRLRRARLVVVPLVDTLQPSGQSAALQAMACGCPVVLTANRGLWDRAQIERHQAAWLVAPGDVAALGDAIGKLLADHVGANAMGMRARSMLESEDVSSAAMARQILAITGPGR